MKPNREELAWAAGLFDGEGSTLYYPAARNLRVQVVQGHPAVVFRFWLAVGKIGTVCGPFRIKSPLYQYQATRFEYVQAVLAMIWFKLSGPKRRQAVEVMKRWKAHH